MANFLVFTKETILDAKHWLNAGNCGKNHQISPNAHQMSPLAHHRLPSTKLETGILFLTSDLATWNPPPPPSPGQLFWWKTLSFCVNFRCGFLKSPPLPNKYRNFLSSKKHRKHNLQLNSKYEIARLPFMIASKCTPQSVTWSRNWMMKIANKGFKEFAWKSLIVLYKCWTKLIISLIYMLPDLLHFNTESKCHTYVKCLLCTVVTINTK